MCSCIIFQCVCVKIKGKRVHKQVTHKLDTDVSIAAILRTFQNESRKFLESFSKCNWKFKHWYNRYISFFPATMLTVDTTIFSSKTSIMLPSSHYYFGSSGCLVIQKECHYDHQAHKKVSIIAISGLIQTLWHF